MSFSSRESLGHVCFIMQEKPVLFNDVFCFGFLIHKKTFIELGIVR